MVNELVVTRGLRKGRSSRWGTGRFQSGETILYDTVMLDAWHYELIKTHRISWQQEQTLVYANLKKIFTVEIKGSQNGMQSITKESNCTINVWDNLTEEAREKGAGLSNWKLMGSVRPKTKGTVCKHWLCLIKLFPKGHG